MGFYEDLAGVSAELLAEFKQGVITIDRAVTGASDPSTPWIPGIDVVITYLLDATAKSVEDKFINGTTIFATDTMVTAGPIMAKTHVDGVAVANEAVATNLAPGDTVKIDGETVTVVREMRLPKAGTLVAFKMIVRG